MEGELKQTTALPLVPALLGDTMVTPALAEEEQPQELVAVSVYTVDTAGQTVGVKLLFAGAAPVLAVQA